MPIGKLLANMSAPPMVSMLAVALYNIIDSIFVAMVSEDALTAVTLVFPVQMIMISVNVGIGVGLASLISRRLGEKRQNDADSAAAHGFVFAVIVWVLYVLFAVFAAEPFLRFFTGMQSNDAIFEMALVYCRIVMIGSVFLNISIAIEKILQGTGNTFHPMIFNIIGVGVNTAMAPILIIGYLGAPSLGVTGAGYAAIIGQFVGFMIAMILIFRKKHAVKIGFRGFRLSAETTRDILVVGAPSIVMQATMPILVGGLNKILFNYASAVFVLGVYYRISTFVVMPTVGLNQGALPIMGYSFGAKNRLRLQATYKTALTFAIIIMAAGTAIFWIWPDRIMMLFSASEYSMDLGIHALRTISVCFVTAAFSIITIGMFQALAHGGMALVISVVRQLGLILPLAYILLIHYDVYAVWYSYPIAEVVAVIITIFFLRSVFRNDIRPLPDGAPVEGRV